MKRILGIVAFFFLFSAGVVFSYDLVLKNGKVIQGKLIQEDADKFIIEDKSGVRINFKKSNVDIEKTTEANQVKEETTAKPETKSAEEEKAVAEPKKPARVYTEGDINRLRDKSPILKSNTTVEEPEEEESDETPKKAKGEEYWKSTARQMYRRMQQTEEASKIAQSNCQKLQGATIQTHQVVNEEGEVLDMQKTRETECQQAEDLKAESESAKQEYEAFMQEARMEGVPPGWLNVD